MSEPEASQPSEDPVDAIICEYLEAAERGEPPSKEEFLARHPQFAPQLREFFSDWQGVPIDDEDDGDHEPWRTKIQAASGSYVPLQRTSFPFDLDDFELVKEIGRGGMGQVFEAQQKSLRRRVAVKAMSIGRTSARHGHLGRKAADRSTQQLRGRFLREAEVTGGLQHPGIVPVYAVGAAQDGQPFYAMRLIEGESLHDAIERFHAAVRPGEDFVQSRGLEFRRLLRRLIDVCNAIEYAHSQKVIHRDLKPRNIMLGRFGETLVVDWGLAKLSDGAHLGDTLPLPSPENYSGTHQGSAVGTPAFMSPEQASGELDRLSPASDVYSLGATLYCLMTGKPAFDGKDVLAIFEQIKQGVFAPPRALQPSLPVALEAICLKAMARDRSVRYASAAALADDLDRWLADEPVSAYQESFSERCARWARRHRTWIRAASVTSLILAIGAGVSAWQIHLARQATEIRRQQAVSRLKQASEAADRWLTGVSTAIEFYPGLQEVRLGQLEKAAQFYDEFAQGASDDPALEVERGRTKLRLGDVRRILNDPRAAEQAYRSALELFNELLTRSPVPDGARLEAVNSRVRLARTLAEGKRRAEADQLYLEAIAMADALLVESPESFRHRESWLAALVDRAVLCGAQQQWNEAEQLVSRAIKRWSVWQSENPSDARYQQSMAKIAAVGGEIAMGQGKWSEAYATLERASHSLAKLIQQDEHDASYRSDRGSTLVQMAIAARSLGRTQEEFQAYQVALDEYRELKDAFPDVPEHRQNYALTQTDLAQIQLSWGETAEANATAQSAFDTFTSLAEASGLLGDREGLGASADVLGQIQLDRGETDRARDSFLLAQAQFDYLLAESPQEPSYRHRWAVVQSHLAQTHLIAGGEAGAKEAEQCLAMCREVLADLATDSAFPATYRQSAALAEYHCGSLLFEAGQKDSAIAALTEAKRHFNLLIDSPAPPPEYLDQFASFLTECIEPSLRDANLAEQLARRAVEIAQENREMRTTLAAALCRLDRLSESRSQLQAALSQRPTARAYFWMALIEARQKHETPARENLGQGRAWMQARRAGNRELMRLGREVALTMEAGDQKP